MLATLIYLRFHVRSSLVAQMIKNLPAMRKKVKVKQLSCFQLFAAWTVANQASLSMEFSRQEYQSGLPFPSPGDLLDPGMEPVSLALQADALPSEPPRKPCNVGNLGSVLGLGRSPAEGNSYPLQYSDLENSTDCIVSPWGRKELDMTERLSLSLFM